MRVLYLDHVAELSGGELALLRLIEQLPEVEPHVLLAQDGPLAERLRARNVNVEVLPMAERTVRMRRDALAGGVLAATLDTARYALALSRRIRALHPDLVHANSLKAGVYGSIAARLAGVPVIWHVRDRIAPGYLSPPAVALVRLLSRALPDLVICNSTSTQATLAKRARSVVIPSLAAIPAAASTPPSGGERPFTAAMVARITPWKGQDVFIEAFASAFPNGPERAVIIGAPLFGQTDTAYAKRLRALAEDLGIADRVEFRGQRDDVHAELAAADVLVHASTQPEPFGQAVIEGLAAGLAVIASAGGGPAEVITHGIDGLLHPPGDAAELARLLRGLRDDPQLRHRLAAAGRIRARAFSAAQIIPAVMDAYRVAQSRRSAPPAAARLRAPSPPS